jgi:hypothetical protein
VPASPRCGGAEVGELRNGEARVAAGVDRGEGCEIEVATLNGQSVVAAAAAAPSGPARRSGLDAATRHVHARGGRASPLRRDAAIREAIDDGALPVAAPVSRTAEARGDFRSNERVRRRAARGRGT